MRSKGPYCQSTELDSDKYYSFREHTCSTHSLNVLLHYLPAMYKLQAEGFFVSTTVIEI